MKKTLLNLILLVFLPVLSYSQFSIKGTVYDADSKEPLAGAHIVISNTMKATVADTYGNYKLDDLPDGEYVIVTSYLGYKDLEKKVSVSDNIELELAMEMSAFIADEVIIKATRADFNSPTSFTDISKKEIRDQNLGRDIPFLLKTTPSLIVTSDAGNGIGYSGMRIRGSDITRINVTVNGIPLNDAESHGVFWVNMPDFASSIENIQIQRGVGTSTNGPASFGASLNIQTTKLNPDPYSEVNLSGGSFNTYKANAIFGTGLIDGKFSFDGRVSKIGSDGFIDRATSDLKSFYLSGAYYGEKSLLKFVMFSGKEKTYQAWSGVPKDSLKTNRTYNPYTYENETDNYQQDHYQLHYTYAFNKHSNLNASLHYTYGRGYYEQYKDEEDLADYGISDIALGDTIISTTDLIRQKWLDNHFYGMTLSYNYSKSKLKYSIGSAINNYDGDHYGNVIWARFAGESEIDHRWYENNGEKLDFNVFARMNYQLNKKWNAYIDLQYRSIQYNLKGIHDDLRDITQDHQYNFFNPKAGLSYQINSEMKAFISVAIGNREPSRTNFRDAGEDQNFTNETLIDYELGYEFNKTWMSLKANAYYMQYKDQLVLTGEINDVGASNMINVPDSYRAGLELGAGFRIMKNLDWNLNATFSENKIKDFTAKVDTYDENWNFVGYTEEYHENVTLSFSPSLISSSIISLELVKNFNISLISKYVSRQYIDNTENNYRSLDPYFVNNLAFMYTANPSFVREISFFFHLNNFLNEEYETNAWVYRMIVGQDQYIYDGYFPQAGINFLTGINIRF